MSILKCSVHMPKDIYSSLQTLPNWLVLCGATLKIAFAR